VGLAGFTRVISHSVKNTNGKQKFPSKIAFSHKFKGIFLSQNLKNRPIADLNYNNLKDLRKFKEELSCPVFLSVF
jgi:hypothetical protein